MSAPSQNPTQEQVQDAADEQAFWDAHSAELVANHPDQFVAAKDGKIIAAETDLAQLILVLSTRDVDIRDTWVRFVTKDHSKLIL